MKSRHAGVNSGQRLEFKMLLYKKVKGLSFCLFEFYFAFYAIIKLYFYVFTSDTT